MWQGLIGYKLSRFYNLRLKDKYVFSGGFLIVCKGGYMKNLSIVKEQNLID